MEDQSSTRSGKWSRLKKMLSPPQAKVKKEKRSRPRGYGARKAGVSLFWLLFGFMFLTVAVTLFSEEENDSAPKATAVETGENPSVKPEAVEFAESFTSHYFNWGSSEEKQKEREANLQPFLAKGLDPQAGLSTEKVTWNSTYENAKVKKVDDLGENKALITFQVQAELSRGSEEERETEALSKYFVVPVKYDGQSYGIYELPKFTNMNEKTTVEAEKEEKLNKAASSPDTTAVKTFLTTFFKSYAEDAPEQLAYLVEEGREISGLNDSMTFVKVGSADIYESEDGYIVQSQVTLEDPLSKMQFHTDYELSVQKEGERFVVSSINEKEVES